MSLSSDEQAAPCDLIQATGTCAVHTGSDAFIAHDILAHRSALMSKRYVGRYLPYSFNGERGMGSRTLGGVVETHPRQNCVGTWPRPP